MESMLGTLEVCRPKSVGEQIADHVRTEILTGELRPGDKLPSTSELARLWNTHVVTAHEGLQRLVKEGLLVRRPRVGTIVQAHTERLVKVGIYQGTDPRVESQARFIGAMDASLQTATDREHIEVSILLDRRSEAQQTVPLPQLATMVAQHEVQAVVALGIAERQLQWLRQLSVPTTYLCSAEDPRAVDFDHGQFARISLEELGRQGCRSYGLIAPFAPNPVREPGEIHSSRAHFFNQLRESPAELNLTTRPEWWGTPAAGQSVVEADYEEFGYRQFRALWRQAERPAGLVVYPDGVVRGVITALLECQVQVPTQLRLVLHRNAEINYLCPFPACQVVSSAAEAAAGLLQQIQRQLRGERCEKLRISFRIEPAVRPSR